jgi:hypothetical protein
MMEHPIATKRTKKAHYIRTPTRAFNSYITLCGLRLVPAFSDPTKPICKRCAAHRRAPR